MGQNCFADDKMADSVRERKKSKKPSNSNFKQQRLRAWQPILTASTALPLFFVIGVVFIPIGAVLLVASDKNHRRYVRSRDDLQLNGKLKEKKVSSDCEPFAKFNKSPIAPCGAIANSLFNDSFTVTWLKEPSKSVMVGLTYKDIAWKSDREVKFKNPGGDLEEAFKGYAKPPNWPRPVYQLDVNDSSNNGFQNQDFIVWMRTAAFSKFRKLYRKIIPSGDFESGLPQDFPVSAFGGKKWVIFSTTSWIGGKNPFLGIAYITVGVLCLVLGLSFLVIHRKFGKRI
ncbi:Cell cycle control protein 50A [Acropora cervicornis]|uniref:Cell cycle control protein 50A n=1 Tax=Acropora cervicornis TaxID=6130 RepID=A0AAD9QRR1_ACRCE|nr:Cell cycle control protein 50A [Acropora cervicornis]